MQDMITAAIVSYSLAFIFEDMMFYMKDGSTQSVGKLIRALFLIVGTVFMINGIN